MPDTNVDLELMLLIDVSGSMDSSEYALVAAGYAAAFADSEVQSLILGGTLGKIAVTAVQWGADPGTPSPAMYQAIAWTILDSASTINAFSVAIGAMVRATVPTQVSGTSTGMGHALEEAYPLFATSGFSGTRKIIDVSGDGVENVDDAGFDARRDTALAAVDTINGISITANPSVNTFYVDRVIGGVNSFAKSIDDFDEFAAAVIEKITLELDPCGYVSGGKVRKMVTVISGLDHLEGVSVSVVADGAYVGEFTVASGVITLSALAAVVHIGFKYKGILIPLNLVVVGQTQNSISFGKSVSSIALVVAHTIGVKYGTSFYNLQSIPTQDAGEAATDPPVPFTGTIPLPNDDKWEEDKNIIYVQDEPYPCKLNAMNISIEVGEK